MFMSPITAAASATVSDAGLGQILRSVRQHLGMDVAFISEFRDGRRWFQQVECAEGHETIAVGDSHPLEESYCQRVVDGRLPELIGNAADNPEAMSLPVTKALAIGAYMGVPITLRDGHVHGTFCCFSGKPDETLTERDLCTMRAFAQLAAEQIDEANDKAKAVQAKVSKISSIIQQRELQIAYQPVVNIDGGELAFIECLSRFHSRPYQAPDWWFSLAEEVGLGVELELVAIAKAMQERRGLPPSTSISINVSPEAVVSPLLADVLGFISPSKIILEITEHESVRNYSVLNSALTKLRRRGFRLAVDDAGAGHSSLRHILKLRPDFIKLDTSLTRGIDDDPAKRALATALISFSRDTGSEIVAEGVETEAELETLRILGVSLAQGFLFGRPVSLKEMAEAMPAFCGAPRTHEVGA